MTGIDIDQITSILLQFAEHKRKQAEEQFSMSDGLFREKKIRAGPPVSAPGARPDRLC